jgi:3alpha(or 20beta)-hydroxysteroid dehydrogenase
VGRLDGKVAIITGAAHERGQGAVTARLFVAEGAKVVMTDVLDDEGARRARELGPQSIYLSHDVTDEDRWREVVSETEARFGSVDVLVNNAGIARTAPLTEHALEDYMAVVGVNQVGVFLGMKHAVPAMLRAGGGSIVNISSVDGIRGMANVVGYVASKWAVRGMTKTAALEYASRGIRVNSILPGFIETPILPIPGETARQLFDHAPVGRIGQPEDIAPLSLYLASDESRYCTGAEFVVDGGLTIGVPMPAALAGT